MQQIKIPQSQFITNNGMVAGEWLVFLNELIRLSNQIISKDTLSKADNAEFNSIEQSFVSFDTDNEVIESVAITVTDDVIENMPIVMNQDEISFSSPYAQLSAIEKHLYDEVIWSLTV